MPEWYRILARAVSEDSATGVAAKLGVSRASVSLLLAGKYPGNTAHMAHRVMEVMGSVTCPATQGTVSRELCAERRGESMPTSSPAALRRWRQCQECIHHQHNED